MWLWLWMVVSQSYWDCDWSRFPEEQKVEISPWLKMGMKSWSIFQIAHHWWLLMMQPCRTRRKYLKPFKSKISLAVGCVAIQPLCQISQCRWNLMSDEEFEERKAERQAQENKKNPSLLCDTPSKKGFREPLFAHFTLREVGPFSISLMITNSWLRSARLYQQPVTSLAKAFLFQGASFRRSIRNKWHMPPPKFFYRTIYHILI